jgi:hypothetical protein
MAGLLNLVCWLVHANIGCSAAIGRRAIAPPDSIHTG